MIDFKESYDPRTEHGRVELLKHLDERLPSYTGSFPELTPGPTGVLAAIHNRYLMADYIVKGSQNAELAVHNVNDYKFKMFNGPVSTSMTTVPIPAVYGVAPTAVSADFMGYVATLRGLMMKNPNWTDAIAKDLHLYGTEGTFNPDTYVPEYSIHPFTGYLHIHVGVKFVNSHHVYIRKAGTTVWEPFIQFSNSNFDLKRVGLVSPENLEIMLIGVIDNKELPLTSKILPFLYKTTI